MSSKIYFSIIRKTTEHACDKWQLLGETEGYGEDNGDLQHVGPVRGAGSKSAQCATERVNPDVNSPAHQFNTRPTPMQDTHNRGNCVCGEKVHIELYTFWDNFPLKWKLL